MAADEIRRSGLTEAVPDADFRVLPVPPFRFRVSRPWLGYLDIEAPDAASAIAEYDRRMGSAASDHKASVEELDDAPEIGQ